MGCELPRWIETLFLKECIMRKVKRTQYAYVLDVL